MKKPIFSFPVKALAVFLFLIAALTTGVFAVMAAAAYNYFFYSVPDNITSYSAATSYIRDMISEWRYETITSGEWRGLYEFIFFNRYSSILVTAIGIIVLLILFVYLMCAAGRRAYTDEIVLSSLDRVPFDVTFAFGVTAALFLTMFISEMYGDSAFEMIFTGLFMGLILLIALYVLYTFAARVKAGGWWRNTVIFLLLRLIHRWLRAAWSFIVRLARAIPMVWRVSLVSAAYFLINTILLIDDYYHSFLDLFMITAGLAGLSVIILGAAQMRTLHRGARELAAGNLDYKVDTSYLYYDFRRHAENLNSIGEGMSAAVEQRTRSERLKTELITNVSHDIKTPLTSIVNYVDLLQKEHTPEEQVQYLDVLKRQSDKLRRLTVDLVEASKASTGNLPTEVVPTNSSELINQAVAEYAEKFEAEGLEPVITMPEKPITVMADGRHLWRVLDNLFNNTVKYAQSGTRVYIDVRRMDGGAVISVKNISRSRLNISADELMERFVRGDSSRHTEGSGLGLSIARSLTELMGGKFDVIIDGDLFKAEIRLRIAGGGNVA